MIIEKLNRSNVKELYCFLSGIKKVYSFSNLNDFYKQDTNNLKKIVEFMDVEELSKGKHTREIVLKTIKEKLEESLKAIEK